MEATRRR